MKDEIERMMSVSVLGVREEESPLEVLVFGDGEKED